MLTRRGFFIGVGSLLTAAFVRKATAFSRNAGQPLILPPAKRPEETLYLYQQDWQEWTEYPAKWRVSLGPGQPVALPPPTWREYLRSRGHRLETNDDIRRVCRKEPDPGRTRQATGRLRLGGHVGQLHWPPSEGSSPAQAD
jgi:hypothetical protein